MWGTLACVGSLPRVTGTRVGAHRDTRLLWLGIALLSGGCRANIPEGVFTCITDDDCPPSMLCAPETSRCFRRALSESEAQGVEPSAANRSQAGRRAPTAGSAARAQAGSAGGSTGGAAPITTSASGGAGSRSDAASEPACPPGELECDGGCVLDDARNCGSCGRDCTALAHVSGTVSCANAACSFEPSSCAAGWANCSNDPQTGCETDVSVPEHCGACDVQCGGATPICTASGCSSGCPAQAPDLCTGTCVDTQSSAKHCGQCGNACATDVEHAEPVCDHGGCGFACNSGYRECSGVCVDTETDAANCGSCGRPCGDGMSCRDGTCVCPAGSHDCAGSCVDDGSVDSCGVSCTPCRTTVAHSSATCDAGSCGFTCDALYTRCRDVCVDTLSDPANCGKCGTSCSGGERCVAGFCVCPLGTHDCSGSCVSNISLSSCGLLACDSPCPGPVSGSGTPTCDGLACGIRCTSGTLCSKACVDTDTDTSHCGSCSTVCTAGKRCVSGSCECPSGTHSCPSGCVSDSSDASCGSSCNPCPQPTNGIGVGRCNRATLECELQCPEGTVPCSGACTTTC